LATMNGFSQPFAALIDRICEQVLADPERAFAAGSHLMVCQSTENMGAGAFFSERYPSLEPFVAHVTAREPTLVTLGPQLLGFDIPAALELALAMSELQPQLPFDQHARRIALRVVEDNAARVPLARIVDLSFRRSIEPRLIEHPELASSLEAQRELFA